jgi:carboxyl-terminal processing protease
MRPTPTLIACLLAASLGLAAPAFAQAPPAADPQAPAEPAEPAVEDAPATDELVPVSTPPPPGAEAVPLAEIQRYVGVFRAIKDAYVEPISDRDLMRAALRGLLADLDPHSAYLEKDNARALDEMATGRYVGIGVELEQRSDHKLVVVAPIDGGPAARAGIRTGDVIEAIDDRPITAPDMDTASEGLRGAPGTPVKLRLRRGAEPAREVTLVRAQIALHAVTGKLLEPGFGYMRIASFQADTGVEVVGELASLEKAAGGKLRGLVLDLRSNPGGVLGAAVSTADAFLDSGLIVRSRGRLATANSSYYAQPGDLLHGAPMVVLIDSGTASASEVVGGALQDHQRAELMGSRSFGKGSIQSVVALANGDAVKLTTGRYYTPSGRSIQAHGLMPDKVLKGEGGAGLREQDLAGHLVGSDEAADGFARGEVLPGEAPVAAALAELKVLVAKR